MACNFAYNGRVSEIRKDIKPDYFEMLLKVNNLSNENINSFRKIQKESISLRGREADTVRENSINQKISTDCYKPTLELKLYELAVLFSDENYFKSLAYGYPETKGEKLTVSQIAFAFATDEEHVIIKNMLDKKIQELGLDPELANIDLELKQEKNKRKTKRI